MRTFSICAATVIVTLFASLWFYGAGYYVHQDLAGMYSNAAVALTLGEEILAYSSYFPPFERIWFSGAVLLSEATGITPTSAMVSMTTLTAAIGAGFAYNIRARTVGCNVFFFIVPFIALLVLPILYKNVYGLREHLVVIGLWPYLVLRAAGDQARNIGWRTRLMLGLWLGVLLLAKYFYSIIVFLVEVADAMVRRRFLVLFRLENVLAGSIVFFYLLFWLFLRPGQIGVISEIQNLISINRAPSSVSIFLAGRYILIGLAIWLLLVRFRIAPQVRLIGLAAVVGAVLVAWLQERWYSHHMFPVFMMAVIWWWMFGRGIPKLVHAVIAILLIGSLYDEYKKVPPYQRDVATILAAFEEQGIDLSGQRVGLLNQHPAPFNEAIIASGATRWSMPTNQSYVSAALREFDRRDMRGKTLPPVRFDAEGQRLLHGQLMSMWENHPPDALILDATRQWPLRHISYTWEEVLREEPRFQSILADYTLVYAHDADRVKFTYYERKVP